MDIPTAYRIVLAHGNDNSRRAVENAVATLDHALMDSVDNTEDLIAATERYDPDLLICSIQLKDGPARRGAQGNGGRRATPVRHHHDAR